MSIVTEIIIALLYIVRTIVMIINFIGYTVVPQLKNNHGLAIRCYIFTYIILAIVYGCIYEAMMLDPVDFSLVYMIGAIIVHYCNISSALWLQVISFDIWRTFRNVRSVDRRVRERRNGKFICYALYAGVSPIVLGIPGFICYVWVFMHWDDNSDLEFLSLVNFLPTFIESAIYASVCLCNIFFYVGMFCTMRRQRKETAALTEGSNQRHGAQKQWFNLYVKLSLIMGIHMIAWTCIPFTNLESTFDCIYQVSELLHSILIFRFFIWKDGVKQTFRKRICSAVSICSRKISPGEGNTNGSPSPDANPEEALPRVETAF
ncbi:G-protein coupled receptor Mth2-like [Neodiprion lecontei]|uniref:G-protein coupled receptor Mth2-like n=1 Tax=Neodiprion lecontei TaxID=441921 RepID=A0ABM3GP03_NEOLC|nr:G-protein coupled receptor Mth2-like [Neodiprion lecontei]